MNESGARKSPMELAVDIAINLGVVFLVLAYCFQILAPFISLIAWGGIIAIALYPSFCKLEKMLGGRRKTALTLIVLIGGVVIVAPLWMFTTSLLDTALDLGNRIEAGTLSVPPPNDAVRDWPVIGERVYATWLDASASLSNFMTEHDAQVRSISRVAFNGIANAGLGALQFIVSVFIAAAFLANTERASQGIGRLLTRLAGPTDGPSLQTLCVATIRSISVGVLGIAVIQALGAGLGIALVGLPTAGLWALIVLVIAIVQLPPWLVMLPLSFYVFSIESTTVAVIFLIWSLIVSFADMVLKPMLLGRGVDAPMIVILLGAIGGMLLSGIIGLFVGAVVLGVSYKLLQIWVAAGGTPSVTPDEPATSAER